MRLFAKCIVNRAGIDHIFIARVRPADRLMCLHNVLQIKALRRLCGVALLAQWQIIHTAAIVADQNRLIALRRCDRASVLLYRRNVFTDNFVFDDRTDTVMNQDDRIHRILFCCPLERMIDGILRSRPSRHDRRHLRNPVIQHQLLRIPDIILIHSQINPVDLLMLLKQLQGMDQNRLPVNLKKLLRDTRSHPHSASACKYNCNIHVRLLLIYHISLYHY